MSTDLSAGPRTGQPRPRRAHAMTLGAPRARRFTVLRAAAMFDGVSSALMAKPSVVVADGAIAAVHGRPGLVPPMRTS